MSLNRIFLAKCWIDEFEFDSNYYHHFHHFLFTFLFFDAHWWSLVKKKEGRKFNRKRKTNHILLFFTQIVWKQQQNVQFFFRCINQDRFGYLKIIKKKKWFSFFVVIFSSGSRLLSFLSPTRFRHFISALFWNFFWIQLIHLNNENHHYHQSFSSSSSSCCCCLSSFMKKIQIWIKLMNVWWIHSFIHDYHLIWFFFANHQVVVVVVVIC